MTTPSSVLVLQAPAPAPPAVVRLLGWGLAGGPGPTGVVSVDPPLQYDSVQERISIATATNAALGVIALSGDLGGTADAPTVPGLTALNNGLSAETASREELSLQVTDLSTTIGTLATVDALTLETQAREQAMADLQDTLTSSITTETQTREQAILDLQSTMASDLSAKADLINGVVPTSQIPDMGGLRGHVVATQADMLALTNLRPYEDAAFIQNDGGAFIYSGGDPTQLASWNDFSLPNAISLINGQHGPSVTLGFADVGADQAGSADTARQAAVSAAADYANVTFATLASVGSVNGIATLDVNGLLTQGQRPMSNVAPSGLTTTGSVGALLGYARGDHQHPSVSTASLASSIAHTIQLAPGQTGAAITVLNSNAAVVATIGPAGGAQFGGAAVGPIFAGADQTALTSGVDNSQFKVGLRGRVASASIGGGYTALTDNVYWDGGTWRSTGTTGVGSIVDLFSGSVNFYTVTGSPSVNGAATNSLIAAMGANGAFSNYLNNPASVGDLTKQAASQTADSIQSQNSAGSSLFRVDSGGNAYSTGSFRATTDLAPGAALPGDFSQFQLGLMGRLASFSGLSGSSSGTYLLDNAYFDGVNLRNVAAGRWGAGLWFYNSQVWLGANATNPTAGAVASWAWGNYFTGSGIHNQTVNNAAAVASTVTSAASSTSDYIRWNNSGGGTLAKVDSFGGVTGTNVNNIAGTFGVGPAGNVFGKTFNANYDVPTATSLGYDPSQILVGSRGRLLSMTNGTLTLVGDNMYYDAANWRGVTNAYSASGLYFTQGGIYMMSSAPPATNGGTLGVTFPWQVTAFGVMNHNIQVATVSGHNLTGAASQTADLVAYKQSGGTVLGGFNSSGAFYAKGGLGAFIAYERDANTNGWSMYANNKAFRLWSGAEATDKLVVSRDANATLLQVLAPAAIVGDLQDWRVNNVVQARVDNTGAGRFSAVYDAGNRVYSVANPPPGGGGGGSSNVATAATATSVAFTVSGAAGQTADLLEFKDSGGSVLSKFKASGQYESMVNAVSASDAGGGAGGIVLRSPNGTRYRMTVADDGAWVSVAA